MDPSAFTQLLAGFRSPEASEPRILSVRHERDGAPEATWRVERFVEGHTVTAVGDGISAAYDLARGMYSSDYPPDGPPLVEERPVFPMQPRPLAMPVPQFLPIWGGPLAAGEPSAVVRRDEETIHVRFVIPGSAHEYGEAEICTRTMITRMLRFDQDVYTVV